MQQLQKCCQIKSKIICLHNLLREFLLDMTSESELLCNGRQVGADSDEIKGRAGGGDSGGGG